MRHRCQMQHSFLLCAVREGFTLVELLTVMVIIGILASLLFPSLSRVREEARKTVCKENLRQIGQGCMQYAHDFGDYYPTVRGDAGGSRPMASLAMLFNDYVPARETFRCPSTSDDCSGLQPGDTFQPHGPPNRIPSPDRRECSYGYDDTKSRLCDPDVAIAADAPPAPGEEQVGLTVGVGAGQGRMGKNSANHRGRGQNVLYFDGRVKWSPTPFCGVDDDNIYETDDPQNPGETDSYIHQ